MRCVQALLPHHHRNFPLQLSGWLLGCLVAVSPQEQSCIYSNTYHCRCWKGWREVQSHPKLQTAGKRQRIYSIRGTSCPWVHCVTAISNYQVMHEAPTAAHTFGSTLHRKLVFRADWNDGRLLCGTSRRTKFNPPYLTIPRREFLTGHVPQIVFSTAIVLWTNTLFLPLNGLARYLKHTLKAARILRIVEPHHIPISHQISILTIVSHASSRWCASPVNRYPSQPKAPKYAPFTNTCLHIPTEFIVHHSQDPPICAPYEWSFGEHSAAIRRRQCLNQYRWLDDPE